MTENPRFVILDDRGLLAVTGPDRVSFLQGLVSNDMEKAGPDRAVYAASLMSEGGISGSVGWYRATFETARQLRALGEAGVDVPMMAWGGQYGVPVSHSQMAVLSDDVRGGVIEGAGHLLPEETPEFLVRELSGFFTQTEVE